MSFRARDLCLYCTAVTDLPFRLRRSFIHGAIVVDLRRIQFQFKKTFFYERVFRQHLSFPLDTSSARSDLFSVHVTIVSLLAILNYVSILLCRENLQSVLRIVHFSFLFFNKI